MRRIKGMELPVSIIIVMSLALLVMVSVAVLFMGNAGKGSNDISRKGAIANGCLLLRPSCDSIDSISIDINGKSRKLLELCAEEGMTKEQCLKKCGCLDAISSDSAKSSSTNNVNTVTIDESPSGTIIGVDIL